MSQYRKNTPFFLFCFFLNDDAELPRRYPETNFSSKQCGRGSKLRKDGIRCFFFLFFLQQTLLASLLCKLAAKFYSYTLKSSPMILASLHKIRRFSQIKLLLMPRCPCRISPCVVYIFNIYIYRYEQKRCDFLKIFYLFFLRKHLGDSRSRLNRSRAKLFCRLSCTRVRVSLYSNRRRDDAAPRVPAQTCGRFEIRAHF